MAEEGKAFVKGGLGCLVAFIALAVLALITGGSVHMDGGGLILLLVIGGVIGLIVNWIYQRGKRDGGE